MGLSGVGVAAAGGSWGGVWLGLGQVEGEGSLGIIEVYWDDIKNNNIAIGCIENVELSWDHIALHLEVPQIYSPAAKMMNLSSSLTPFLRQNWPGSAVPFQLK